MIHRSHVRTRSDGGSLLAIRKLSVLLSSNRGGYIFFSLSPDIYICEYCFFFSMALSHDALWIMTTSMWKMFRLLLIRTGHQTCSAVKGVLTWVSSNMVVSFGITLTQLQPSKLSSSHFWHPKRFLSSTSKAIQPIPTGLELAQKDVETFMEMLSRRNTFIDYGWNAVI